MAKRQGAPSDVIADAVPKDPQQTERRMMYEVKLKPAHPTGVYRRAGGVFHRGLPTYVEFPIPALENDPWLIVAEEPIEIEWDKAAEVPDPEGQS